VFIALWTILKCFRSLNGSKKFGALLLNTLNLSRHFSKYRWKTWFELHIFFNFLTSRIIIYWFKTKTKRKRSLTKRKRSLTKRKRSLTKPKRSFRLKKTKRKRNEKFEKSQNETKTKRSQNFTNAATLQAISSTAPSDNETIAEIRRLNDFLLSSVTRTSLWWIPSHAGIPEKKQQVDWRSTNAPAAQTPPY
jgi:hypothetical protein